MAPMVFRLFLLAMYANSRPGVTFSGLNFPVARTRSPNPPLDRTGGGTFVTVICVPAVRLLPFPEIRELVPAIVMEKAPRAGTTIQPEPVWLYPAGAQPALAGAA